MNIHQNQIIGKLVADDYRTAAVFKSHGIDFCCNGNRTIEEVCNTKNLDMAAIIQKLESAIQTESKPGVDFKTWPLDLLADYIEKKHHKYVQLETPEIKTYLEKICRVHGNAHPELHEINTLFNESADDLASHMSKEEKMLFPYIREMAGSHQSNSSLQLPLFGSVRNPIQMMILEHENEGERFRKIESLSNNYTPPDDACNTYRVTFALLKEFETDLHLHIHLENNILFPRAVELESTLSHA